VGGKNDVVQNRECAHGNILLSFCMSTRSSAAACKFHCAFSVKRTIWRVVVMFYELM